MTGLEMDGFEISIRFPGFDRGDIFNNQLYRWVSKLEEKPPINFHYYYTKLYIRFCQY